MKILSHSHAFYQTYFQGFFVARQYFDGPFLREVFLTCYDIPSKRGCYGYMYVCKNVVLLYLTEYQSYKNVVLQIEPTDKLQAIQSTDTDFQSMMNRTTGVEKSISISTTNPIYYIYINTALVLIPNIQASINRRGTIWAKTLYITPKNSQERTENFLLLVDTILHKKPFNQKFPTLGISARLAIINITCMIAILCGIAVFMAFMMSRPQ